MSTAAQTMGTIQGMAQLKQTTETTRLTGNQADAAEIDAKRKEFELAADIADEAESNKGTSAMAAIRQMQRAERDKARAHAKQIPAQTKLTEVEEELKRYDIPEAKSNAQFYQGAGQATPWMKALTDAIKTFRLIK